MLRFFRNIRQKLIEQENIRKYVLYAIGEILLVMIGILLALQVNNWNENRKQTNKEYELLSQLKGDIDLLIVELSDDLLYLNEQTALTDTIIYFEELGYAKNWIAYSKNDFTSNPKVFPTRATFDNLKSIGMEIISNPELRNKITDLYDRKLTRAAIWENNVYEYEDRIKILLERSFEHIGDSNNQFAPIFRPDSYNEFVSYKELRNALITMQDYRKFLVERYNDVLFLAEEIMKEVDK